MPKLSLLLMTLLGVIACEQRYSAEPPVGAESLGPASSSSSLDALLAPSAGDAGPAVRDTSHALVVTLCSASPKACPADADASTDGSYRVVFGSMADLYKELRDRTKSGEQLDAEPHSPGDGRPTSGGSSTRGGADSSDPIAQVASHLLDLVDGVGEVSLDVVHFASGGCVVSLGRSAGDGGASQCMIKGPERAHSAGRKGF
jgi:hypothetical protein